MDTVTLSTELITNAIAAPKDAFVSIGSGLEVLIPGDVKNGDSWILHIEPFKTPKHVVHTTQGKELFIVSEHEILSQIVNNLVISPNDTKQTVNPNVGESVAQPNHRSHSLVSFYNHLFLVKGRTLWWTDLDNPWEWWPTPQNEADFRTVEWESFDCTGLVRAGDKLYMHFPNAVYEVNYVGKPTIIHIGARIHGIGAVTPRCLCVHNTTQFFIGTDNFYLWSLELGLTAIGQDVWKKFKTQTQNINNVWVYIDQRNNEICWVTEQYVWAFNFLERTWFKYSADFIQSHQTVSWYPTAQILDESLSIIEADKPFAIENVWTSDDVVVRESRFDDGLDRCLVQPKPFLESDDITYGDLHFVKKVDLLMLDMRLNFPWKGVRTRVSGRDFVSHSSRWVDCGLWTQEHRGKQIDFRAVVGKVLKFRLELEDGLGWSGLLPNGGLSLDGKRLDIANGEIMMDGTREDFLGRQFAMLDGTRMLKEMENQIVGNPEVLNRLGFAELNAWGERVDLPASLVGPDK